MADSGLLAPLKALVESKAVLTASSFTPKQKQALENFARQTGLISIHKQGRSTIYQVRNKAGLVQYIRTLQPLETEQLQNDLPNRSRNIGLHRDSKQGLSGRQSCYLLLKAVGENVYWHNESHRIDAVKQTLAQGVVGLKIKADDLWNSETGLFLVENQALFDRTDWLPKNFNGCLVYYAGNLPNALLQWLSWRKRVPEIVLFADYDGVGLANYLKLLEQLDNDTPCRFYMMPGWRRKLAKFGNAAVWQNTRQWFDSAVQGLIKCGAMTAELSDLVQLMQLSGKALEQEAVWLDFE